MIRISKDPSLLAAEVVLNHFTALDEQTDKDIQVSVRVTMIGRSSSLMFVDDMAGKVAWVLLHRVSDGVRLLFGRRDNNSYDFKNVPLPNDATEEVDLAYNEHYQAGKALFDFFTKP